MQTTTCPKRDLDKDWVEDWLTDTTHQNEPNLDDAEYDETQATTFLESQGSWSFERISDESASSAVICDGSSTVLAEVRT